MQQKKLEALIVERGLTKKELAKKLSISPKTFYNKMKSGIFGTDEVKEMVKILHIENPVDIFLS